MQRCYRLPHLSVLVIEDGGFLFVSLSHLSSLLPHVLSDEKKRSPPLVPFNHCVELPECVDSLFPFFFFSFKAATWCFEHAGLSPKYSIQPSFILFMFLSLTQFYCHHAVCCQTVVPKFSHLFVWKRCLQCSISPRSNKSGAGRRWGWEKKNHLRWEKQIEGEEESENELLAG